MPRKSAGIVLYRLKNNDLEVLLVHPGGPFWSKKDEGVWSIPKGEFDTDEDALIAAKREFKEETGTYIDGEFIPLSPIEQKGGKVVYAWAFEGDLNPEEIICNTLTLEWPPMSGIKKEFPEIDKAAWFSIGEVSRKIINTQYDLIKELVSLLHLKGKPK